MAYRHIENLYRNTEILLFKQCIAMEKIHGCLHKDTPVLTDRGEVRICDVFPGDFVFSFDEKTHTFEKHEVLQVFKQEASTGWLAITLENGRTLLLTKNHRVLTKTRGWVEAYMLSKDDEVITYIESP